MGSRSGINVRLVETLPLAGSGGFEKFGRRKVKISWCFDVESVTGGPLGLLVVLASLG